MWCWEGTGLGLCISQDIVASMGGRPRGRRDPGGARLDCSKEADQRGDFSGQLGLVAPVVLGEFAQQQVE